MAVARGGWQSRQGAGGRHREAARAGVERGQALVTCPDSKALAERLGVEEKKLAQLQDQLSAVTAARPKVLPHPGAIAKFVTEWPR